jgi:aminoglycoside phosphotransferase family enzyme/predicted kinase
MDIGQRGRNASGELVDTDGHCTLVEALLDPATYPHGGTAVQLRETHLSWIFLVGAYAYKVKKPVAFGFVDFSTVERRAAACAEEVRLNRRLCPDVYLDVVDIVERDGCLHVGGPGRPVEPAVKMRRLPEGGMLATLLDRSAVDARQLRRVGTRLARFHATAATGTGIDEWGRAEAIRANWADNIAQTDAIGVDVLLPALVATIRAESARFLACAGPMIARRVAEGRVRDGHGDLHVGNVCFEGRRIHLFDCLEFSPRYRCADVAAEVAFLMMDLTAHGRADLAAAFVKSYVAESGDRELPGLLDFFASYRAWVRGKVLALRLSESGLPPDERQVLAAGARRYFMLAWSYATGLSHRPLVVVTLGRPASGKTRLAQALAGHMGLLHLSSDVVRKEMGGYRPTTYRKESFGSGLYTPAMSRRTYTALRWRAGRSLRQGQAVVLDGTYGQSGEREAVRRLAHRHGARLIMLECRATDTTLRARLAARAHDPHVVSDARLPLWADLQAAFVPLSAQEEAVTIDMDGPFDLALARALDTLGVPQDGWMPQS